MTKIKWWEGQLEGFKKVLKIGDHTSEEPHSTRWTLLYAWLILICVSFGMLWLGDKINASGMAVTRFVARVQAPLTAQFTSPTKGRDQITVVMYDQEFLKSSGSAWPISYQDHADALLRLAGDPGARPKAIMLDITFGQERKDPTIAALQQALCTIQNEYKVPVFLAAIPSPEDGQLAVRTGLNANPAGGKPACFTLVGVDYIPDPLDGLAWSYQLSRHRTDTGWESGPPHHPQQEPTYRSAAMTMAQDVAHLELGEETEPMALVWGHNSAPQANNRPERLQHCRPGQPSGWSLIPGVLSQIWEKSPLEPLCPYHQTLSMAQLGELSESELAPFLGGRYVMVGANVPGYNDFADSPVHRVTPGVYMHAMALDNLLTYEGNYKLSAEWTLPPSWELLVPGLLVISVVFFARILLSVARGRVRSWLKPAPQHRRCRTPPTLPKRRLLPAVGSSLRRKKFKSWQIKRLLNSLLDGFLWLVRLTIQTVLAMVLIGFLQSKFRIGMLPVVELIGMTLLAEGLEYVEKIRSFLFEEAPPSTAVAVNK